MSNAALGAPLPSGADEPGKALEVAPAIPKKTDISRAWFGDKSFYAIVVACGTSVLVIVGLILYELISRSDLAWKAFGFKFFVGQDWDPVNDHYGALPFVYGTVVSSLLALLLAVPVSMGVAIFITEMCPRRLKTFLSFMTELLAAIPSVIYGLWAIFVLVPLLRENVEPFLIKTLGWTGLFAGQPFGIGMLAAGIILAIMVVPIISSMAREVMTAVPSAQREAVYALGATRWEMIRMGVLRNARAGIVGGVILGLGRALGETMAVTMVIGNRPEISKLTEALFAPAHTMASVIANEFSEATGDLYLSALIEVGLALFVVTVIVNILAQLLVWSVTRGMPARGNG